jgi:uncharacterized RDD family membrane protein YckC
MRRLAAMFYDWVLLIAVILVAVTAFTISIDLLLGKNASIEALQHPLLKLLYQAYLLVVAALFYIWFWTHGGQTLGMKVWKLKIVSYKQQNIHFRQALLRFLLAVLSCLPFGLGLFWALFNRDKLSLYDQWSKTCLITIESQTVSSTYE